MKCYQCKRTHTHTLTHSNNETHNVILHTPQTNRLTSTAKQKVHWPFSTGDSSFPSWALQDFPQDNQVKDAWHIYSGGRGMGGGEGGGEIDIGRRTFCVAVMETISVIAPKAAPLMVGYNVSVGTLYLWVLQQKNDALAALDWNRIIYAKWCVFRGTEPRMVLAYFCS